MEILLRSKARTWLKTPAEERPLANGPTRFASLSSDGALCAIGLEDRVSVVDVADGAERASVAATKAVCAAFSPNCEFLALWRRATNVSNVNLIVYSLSNHQVVLSTPQKRQELPQFDTSCARMCVLRTNTVEVYETCSFFEPKVRMKQVRINDVVSFGLAPLGCAVGYLSLSKTGGPARVGLMLVDDEAKQQLPSKSAFRVEEATYLWARDGRACLIKTESSYDATGQSYYGESSLQLCQANNKYDVATVELAKEGAVHDVCWSPDSRWFCVIAGKMPSITALYSSTNGKLIKSLGTAHRSASSFSPDARLLMVGGFGNLTGDMDFYEIKDAINAVKIGTAKASCAVSYGWSPDSSNFVCASLSPRMKVDNGFEVFMYHGGTPKYVYKSPNEELLLQCDIVPRAFAGDKFVIKKGVVVADAAPVGVYRPSKATGSLSALLAAGGGGTGHFAATRKAAKKTNDGIPGMKPKEAGVPGMKPKAVPGTKPPPGLQRGATPPVDTDKRVRKLIKLLKQIAVLEENSGELTPEQKAKIARKPEILTELEQLGGS